MSSVQCFPKLYQELFHTTTVPGLGVSVAGGGSIAAAHLNYQSPVALGKSFPYTLESSYLVQFQIRQTKLAAQWCNGRVVPTEPYPTDTVSIYDMREEWRTEMREPFEVLHCHITQDSLDRLSDAHNAQRVALLRASPKTGLVDPMMRHFANLLLPSMDGTIGMGSTYVDHVLSALHEYIAVTYGGMRPGTRAMQGAMASWRLRRATDFMVENIARDLSLEEIALHCEMSVSHFLRAFRRSTGETPHRWLMKARASQAMELLKNPGMSLSTIAAACGFADQSHFTRVFSTVYGMTPGNWRRATGPRKSGNNTC